MNQKLLSIIVPIYNCEAYLEKSITSLINQTYKNLEIILINDGSTDNSLNICNKFAKIDDRIKVLSQKNKGVSTARNLGLETAKGDYITFVDGDDYIDLKTYEMCFNYIEKYNLDIVKFSYNIVNDKYVKPYKFITETDVKITKDEYVNKIYKNLLSTEDFSNVWNIVFTKSILKTTRFCKNIKFGEDLLFSYEVILNSENMYLLEIPLYYYVYNQSGASKSVTIEQCIKRTSDEALVNKLVCDMYLEQIDLSENAKKRVQNSFIHNLKQLAILKKYQDYKLYLDYILLINSDLLEIKIIAKERKWYKYIMYKLCLKFKAKIKGEM